ncbi:RES family NAD+ phosphorylase [Arthrobacter sp. H35-D1]|nr:RES family NAD+ phosphorylase [Arthrobacter sp. H35-D1]MDJ0314072.1 RES family NAD+ phosphorylase [Arthrobacter sp. H35-D1]
MYRLFGNAPGRRANQFNPRMGSRTRFAFFGTPTVPVLYAAATEEAAICATLLHDVPTAGGMITAESCRDKVMARISPTRELRMAKFMGTGLRTLKIDAQDITATTAARYGETVRWAAAAHEAGLDGAVWMSHRCNTDRAYVLFGDRVDVADLVVDSSYARAFALEPDLAWLTDLCVPLHVDVRW